MYNRQSGNILFYILIAVALLAALSYTVTNSFRGGGGALSQERALLNASEMIEYGNLMASAVSQTRLRGHKEEEISFENSTVAGYANPNCMETECKIFNLAGGGVTYLAPKEEWLDATQKEQPLFGALYFNGSTSVSGAGTAADDLIMMVPYINKELCMGINKKLGIQPPSSDTPQERNGPADMGKKFIGTFDTLSDTEISGAATTGNPDILNGKSAGCTESSGGSGNPPSGTYAYYQVLIAR